MNRTEPINERTYFDSATGTFLFLPEIIQFGTDREMPTDTMPVTVNWEVKNATTVTINGEGVTHLGIRSFTTTNVLIVELSASNDLGITVKRALKISALRNAPTIEFFTIDKDFVVVGMEVTLSWRIAGAAKIEIDNGVGDVTGRNSIGSQIRISGVFNITAYNHFGDKMTKSASVIVFPIPVIENFVFPVPKFVLKPISSKQLNFNSVISISCNLQYYQSPKLKLIEFETKTLLNRRQPINFLLFEGNKFIISESNHKSIIFIIKSLWKKIFKDKIAESLQQN
jgi:hypothetical protein